MSARPLLEIDGLTVGIGGHAILKGVSLSVHPGEKLAVIGESGSGKSVTMLSILGLFGVRNAKVTGRALLEGRDLLACSEKEMAAIRGGTIGMVFQDPMTSLNPAIAIGRQLRDVVSTHDPAALSADPAYLEGLLESVGIEDAARCLRLYPHELSGGMRQRVMIAMAVACKPGLLIADEPTTALDVTVQRQIVGLLVRLCEERRIGLIFISHNLDLVGEFCDRIAVMLRGEIVETGSTDAIFAAPEHPYTRRLLASIPRIEAAATAPEPQLKGAGGGWPVLTSDNVSRFFPNARSVFGRFFDHSGKLGLAECSLDIAAGELLGIVGESGSGKTTLARMLVVEAHILVFASEESIRHASRSETCSSITTCSTQRRRRAGLRSFPGQPPPGSASQASDPNSLAQPLVPLPEVLQSLLLIRFQATELRANDNK